MPSSQPPSHAVCHVVSRSWRATMAARVSCAVTTVLLLDACVRLGYETVEPSKAAAGSSSGQNTKGSSLGGSSGTLAGFSLGGSHHSGGSDSYPASGGNSLVTTGGSPSSGSSHAGGGDQGTTTVGVSSGGHPPVGGRDSGATTVGVSLGGALVGGSGSASQTSGSAAGGASHGGGSASSTNTGGTGNGGTTSRASGGNTQAAPSALGDCCRFTHAVILEGAAAVDTQLSQNTVSALSNACGSALLTRQISQDASGVLDASGRPLVGPTELVVMSGGFVTQKAMAYLDQNDTPVYGSATATNKRYTVLTRAGAVIASIKVDSFTAGYDVAIIAVTREPISQTFVINVYGYNSIGTQAGVFYFANTLSPNLKSDPHHYYVVEWTDLDGDQAASAQDQYVVLASG